MQRLLGIDYGSKRIGIALSNETNDFALPHSVITNSKIAVSEIIEICQKNGVAKIVVGESKNFEQQDNAIMADIRTFVGELQENSGLEVVLQPEFLTSFQAQQTIYDLGGDVNMLDASAAAIILQSYLDIKQ